MTPPSPLPFVYAAQVISSIHTAAMILAVVLLIGAMLASNRRRALAGAAVAALVAIATPSGQLATQMALWIYLQTLSQEQ